MHKLWIDPDGNLIPVGDDLSHEQWANRHKNADLETLLQAGWIRVQMVVPRYLYLDFQVRLTEGQVTSVARLFDNQVGVVLVDFGGESMTFADTAEAKRFVLGAT